MNIKSLLLGSAAVLVAVSGARAADAVVIAEPEPAEYVRVCDVYGAGFYYMPGTETCIKIGGYVRYQYNFNGNAKLDTGAGDFGGGYDAVSRVRGRLNFDIREETDLGTLRGFVRLQAQNTNGSDANFQMTQAYLQLAGLTAGYYDSLWTSDIGGADDGLLTDTDLAVGDVTANVLSYTYAVDGITGTLSVENPVFTDTGEEFPGGPSVSENSIDVVGKVAYSGAWGGAYVAAVYDGEADYYGAPSDLGEGTAFKGGLWVTDLLMADSTFKIEGTYALDETDFATVDSVLVGDALPLLWTAGAGYSFGFGDFSFAFAGRYGQTFDDVLVAGGDPIDVYNLVGNIGYDITDNLGLLTEISYEHLDIPAVAGSTVDATEGTTSGFVRLQRSF
ncbi:porin [Aureimonas fodinaquatilis]|uniref:Porin n=1 Tax=Aureimonas fodinaquatilis TaxID=2565783 RepID=A0A5B0DZ63_9HYPH|nr:porin [Aureimonas fodinaquatilis]KAA0971041.1 porin [Aureimonas fodinaquatilis]